MEHLAPKDNNNLNRMGRRRDLGHALYNFPGIFFLQLVIAFLCPGSLVIISGTFQNSIYFFFSSLVVSCLLCTRFFLLSFIISFRNDLRL